MGESVQISEADVTTALKKAYANVEYAFFPFKSWFLLEKTDEPQPRQMAHVIIQEPLVHVIITDEMGELPGV